MEGRKDRYTSKEGRIDRGIEGRKAEVRNFSTHAEKGFR